MNKTARVIVEQVENLLPKLRKLTEGHARPDHPAAFASEWADQERAGSFWLGIPNHQDRPTLILCVYALREMTADRQDSALNLLREASRLLRKQKSS